MFLTFKKFDVLLLMLLLSFTFLCSFNLYAVMIQDIMGVTLKITDGTCYKRTGICSIDFLIINSETKSSLRTEQSINVRFNLPMNPELKIGQIIRADLKAFHNDLGNYKNTTYIVVPESIIILEDNPECREIPVSIEDKISKDSVLFLILFLTIVCGILFFHAKSSHRRSKEGNFAEQN